MTEKVDARNQTVTCSECGTSYTCTPERDYFNSTTLEDGVCEPCLLAGVGIVPDKVRVIEPKNMMLMPPAPDRCQVCAADHAPEEPHNPQSLYWATKRNMDGQPPPTWFDALSHVSDEVRERWVAALAEHGVVVPPR